MHARRGQSVLEYTIIVSVLMITLFYMGTSIKRGMQSLVKVTADQVGSQQNADQDFNDVTQGYMVLSNTQTAAMTNKEVTESGYFNSSGNAVYLSNTIYNEVTDAVSNTVTNGGFSPDNN